ncbi:MAG: iron ABC transporter permease [bacterium]|nr:iron ABC transporter permease [bacterium]MDE0438417.1 iron ABC transporter permease [bacterium]
MTATAVVGRRGSAVAAPEVRSRRVLVTLGSVLVALMFAYVMLGPVIFGPDLVLRALFDRAEEVHHRISVWEVRVPRVLIAAIAGAMLSSSGALLQSVLRNPLAAPATVGVTQGAVLGAVLALVITFGSEGALNDLNALVPLAAIAGGLVAGAIVYVLSYRRAGTDPIRLILTGVVVAAAVSSVTSFMVLISGSHIDSIVLWLVGSLSTRTWDHLVFLVPVAVLVLPLVVVAIPLANALQLGDSASVSLGLRSEAARAFILMTAVVLAAGSVSVVGGIAFLGLIGPHLARTLVGSDLRRLLICSALVGAVILVGADLLARVFSLDWIPLVDIRTESGSRVPVGAFTALVGAPFFLYLMRERVR